MTHLSSERRRLSPSHRDRDIQIQPYELLPPPPPPPPLRPGFDNNHSKNHSPSEPSSKLDIHPDSVCISSTRSIHSPTTSIAAPYAPPALSVTPHSFLVDIPQPTKYYSRPPATASFQPPMTVTASQLPQPHVQVQTQQQPRSQSSSAFIPPFKSLLEEP
ncbi:unnamed protein product [Penicillium palitans]